MAAHPEIRQLFGTTGSTAIFAALIVALQIAVGANLNHAPWWAIFLAAYTIGAVTSHALFVIVHDCTHNLAFKSPVANRLTAMLADVGIAIPSSSSFRRYHLLHHRYQGEHAFDADLPGYSEAKFWGQSPVHKTFWMLFFPIIEGMIRPMRLKGIKFYDGWTALNIVLVTGALGAAVYFTGWTTLLYLLLSTAFGVGLHPLGARWIQEHYVFTKGQETYSYYGPFNKVMFNVGYHNEHHDLTMVPWNRLPKVKAMAPEFYDSLHSHQSYVKLLMTFLFSPSVNLYSRYTRPDHAATPSAEPVTEKVPAVGGIPTAI